MKQKSPSQREMGIAMAMRVGFEPPTKDPTISPNHQQCPVTMPFYDKAGRAAQKRDTQGFK
jgi:hypothetical protein